jgi:hypothetical protein
MSKKKVTYQDFNLILNRVNKTRRDNDFPNIGYAFEYLVLEEIYNDVDDVTEYITDGPGDQGIDAVVVQNGEVDIFQFKFTEKFDNCKKDTLSTNPVNSIEATLRRISSYDQDFLESCNIMLQSSIKEIWRSMEEGEIKITVHFYTNLDEPLKPERINVINKHLADFGAKAQVYGINDLMSLILKNKVSPFNAKFQLSTKAWFENLSSGHKYIVGVIDALSFIESLIKEGKNLTEDIFDENVRMYLRRKGKINNAIFKTAAGDENNNFFFYNNGITIICDGLEYSKSVAPFVNIQNLKIVNGSQTVHALFEVYQNPTNREKLRDVSVLLRIYEVKDREMGQKIAEFTNSQNPVKTRDLRSNDLVQTKLEEMLKDIDIYYARKRNQFYGENVPKDKIIDSEKLGQVLLAFYMEKPGAAKNSKKEIYGSRYDTIFDPDKINPDYILTPYRIFQKIYGTISELKKERIRLTNFVMNDAHSKKNLEKFSRSNEYLFHSAYYWLMAVKLIALRKGVDISISSLPKLEKLIMPAKKLIKKMVDGHKELSPAELFKSDTNIEELKKLILQ